MEGVTLIRTSGSSMFRFGRSEDVKKISGYTGFKNITFHGGTIDGQGAQHGYKSTLLRFAHASDVTIEKHDTDKYLQFSQYRVCGSSECNDQQLRILRLSWKSRQQQRSDPD